MGAMRDEGTGTGALAEAGTEAGTEPGAPPDGGTGSGAQGEQPAAPAAGHGRRFAVPSDRQGMPAVGHKPENRRQLLVKVLWTSIWMVYLSAPVSDLWSGGHSGPALALGALGLASFVGAYVALIFFRHTGSPLRVHTGLGVLMLLALVLALALGSQWLVLFVYCSVAAGAVLPRRRASWVIPASVAVLVVLGLHIDGTADLWPALFIPALLGGFAMAGVRQMIRTTRELREARAAVADLAASQERLRLARDLHDLLGHSLSLITLKSELAGRMLPGEPEAAAAQVADIERVSRQALVDVREAVSDYRRPTLRVELASAATALGAAGISSRLPETSAIPDDLHPDQESALAWALREACTNVVRHSAGTRCSVALTEQADETLCLSVTDDGRGADAPRGNGLTGLGERLALADGALETGPGVRGGFQLRAVVPARPRTSGARETAQDVA